MKATYTAEVADNGFVMVRANENGRIKAMGFPTLDDAADWVRSRTARMADQPFGLNLPPIDADYWLYQG